MGQLCFFVAFNVDGAGYLARCGLPATGYPGGRGVDSLLVLRIHGGVSELVSAVDLFG